VGQHIALQDRSDSRRLGRLLSSDVQDWRLTAQARLLGALGSARLGSVLLGIAAERFKASEVFGFRLREGQRPEMLVSHGKRGHAASRASLYLDRFSALDPIDTVIRAQAREECVTVATFRSRDIADKAYRSRCFEHAGLVEKVSCFHRRGNEIFVLAFYRTEVDFHDLAPIVELAQLALPVLERQSDLLGEEAGLNLSERLEKRLSCHFPSLTARELGVCARTLAGMTAEAIALELGIGRASVLTYRRRAYERYGISSAGELIEDILG